MHRRPLLLLLDDYLARHPDEEETVVRMRTLVETHEDCLLRSCAPGHVTASAWIASPDRRRFLLTHHRKLDRWLQLGGHVDGEAEPDAAALREAREESGMERFEICAAGDRPLVVDLDVHVIPARGDEPEHEHHDVRFLLIAAPGQTAVRNEESKELRWFRNDELAAVAGDEAVARLGRKAIALLERLGPVAGG
ncbi:MAG: NUDIX hydrolase [Planctomycetota bacterium JB042]